MNPKILSFAFLLIVVAAILCAVFIPPVIAKKNDPKPFIFDSNTATSTDTNNPPSTPSEPTPAPSEPVSPTPAPSAPVTPAPSDPSVPSVPSAPVTPAPSDPSVPSATPSTAPLSSSLADGTFDSLWNGYDYVEGQKPGTSQYMALAGSVMMSQEETEKVQIMTPEQWAQTQKKKAKLDPDVTVIVQPQLTPEEKEDAASKARVLIQDHKGNSHGMGMVPRPTPVVVKKGKMKKGVTRIPWPPGAVAQQQFFDARKFLATRKQKQPPIWDQKMCGCCWAFSSSTAMTYRLAWLTQKNGQPIMTTSGVPLFPVDVSQQYYISIYEATISPACDGASPFDCFEIMKKNGIVFAALLPYSKTTANYYVSSSDRLPLSSPSTATSVTLKDASVVGPGLTLGVYNAATGQGEAKVVQSIKSNTVTVPALSRAYGVGDFAMLDQGRGKCAVPPGGNISEPVMKPTMYSTDGGITWAPQLPAGFYGRYMIMGPQADLCQPGLGNCCNVPSMENVNKVIADRTTALGGKSPVLKPTGFVADIFFNMFGNFNTPDETSIKAEILTRGPVVASLQVTSEFSGLKTGSGILTKAASSASLSQMGPNDNGHAVTIIGWGTERVTSVGGTEGGIKYWLIHNSWGTSWGDGGFAKIEIGALNICAVIAAASVHPNPYLAYNDTLGII